MFAIPLVQPTHDFSRYLPNPPTDPTETGPGTDGQTAQNQRRQNATHPTSTKAALKNDEAVIQQRKVAIARYGATWIRPPGVNKTLQAETEEKLEREEQEMLARRDQLMLDMQAQQEAEEARQRAAATEAMDEMEDGEERDLDDDVPEGSTLGMDADLSAEEGGLSLEETAMSDEEGTTEADMTFNDGSLIEGSMLHPGLEDEENSAIQHELEEQERYAQLEEAELTGATQEGYELGMEGNLDDSIPEAGSYEHTDTELEDDDSDDDASEASISIAHRPHSGTSIFDARRSLGARLSGGSAGSRASLSGRDVSSLLDSSFITSSPMLSRGRQFPSRGRPR